METLETHSLRETLRRFWRVCQQDWRTLPNLLTFFRILGAPIVAILLWMDYPFAALLWFIILAISDFLDGYLAKRNNGQLTTKLGKMIDPIADKFLLVIVFLAIVTQTANSLVWCLFGAILLREVAVAICHLAKLRRQVDIQSALEASRFATTFEAVAIPLLVLAFYLPAWKQSALTILVFATGAAIISGAEYVYQISRQIKLQIIPALIIAGAATLAIWSLEKVANGVYSSLLWWILLGAVGAVLWSFSKKQLTNQASKSKTIA